MIPLSRKRRKKNRAEKILLPEVAQPQYSNPITGLGRLFDFLGSCSSFPVSVRTAAVVSGIPEEELIKVIKGSLYYFVWNGEITSIRSA